MTDDPGRHRGTAHRLALLALTLIGLLIVSSSNPEPWLSSGSLSGVTLPGRQVWGHMVPHGLADYRKGVPQYGSDYPLDLIAGGYADQARSTSGVPRAQQAGLTGMQILQFDWENKGSDFVDNWMAQADRTWTDQNTQNNFSIAPCWLLTRPGSAVRMAREYSAAAKGHPSAARIDGKLVIYVYSPRNLTPQQWKTERQNLRNAGLDVYLIADLQTDSSQHGYTLDTDLITPWAPNFDATWLFDDSTPRIWKTLQTYLRAQGKPFAGGIMPGYDRETSDKGGYVSPEGTKQFRRQWENQLDSGATWANVISWNDAVERTNIKASSDWNITRQDINAFYAAKLRNIAYPKPRPELYITTPDYIRIGQAPQPEGLVLNGGTTPITVHTRLIDKNKKPLSPTTSTTIAPGTSGDATTPTPITTYPTGHFARAETWTTDTSGHTLDHVTSAPILIYDTTTQATPMMRQHFYSIPASKALNTNLTITTNTTNAEVRADSDPEGARARFLEILQNTRQTALGFDTTTVSAQPLDRSQSTLIVGQEHVSADTQGFYVARAVDDEERVAYSDPVQTG